ncbi:MAG: hypothetical protein O3C21_14150 [Verrucomicrobia bacterium]|nr:hypothetical protein [Verrucomicrobiota bacterium]
MQSIISQHWRGFLLLVAAFLPALVMGVLVQRFAVNVPVWDDWERVRLIEKFEEGKMTVSDLYAPHIEHRMVIPRIVMLTLNKGTGGDLKAEMGVIFFTVFATAVAVFLLLRDTLARSDGLLYGTAFCANLLLFSPLQWENFLWAVQVAFMLPMCCVCWALVVLRVKRHWSVGLRFGFCLLLALVATHSFSHGMLVWPVVLMSVLLQPDFSSTARSKWKFLSGWIVAAALVLGCYFSDLQNASHSGHAYNQMPGEAPPGIANFSATIANPDKAIHFFGSFLGNPLARITRLPARDVAPWFGWTLAACFALGAARWFLRWKHKDEIARALPWLALGGTAVTVALMVALSRAEVAGVRSALTPRYNSMSLYLLLSVGLLGMIFGQEIMKRSGSRQMLFSIFTGAFLVTQFQSWAYGIVRMEQWENSRLHSLTSLLYINHFYPEADTRLDVSPAFVRDQANILNRYGYLAQPLARNANTEPFTLASKPLPTNRWALDRVEMSSDGDALEIAGWTLLPESAGGTASHGILVTRPAAAESESDENDASPADVLQVASIHALPPMSSAVADNAFNFKRELDRPDFSSWSARVPIADLFDESIDSVVLKLFAVDARKMRMHRLAKKITVTSSGTVTVEDTN